MLNAENYYSLEMDQEYMSVSQFKEFMNCEAKAYALVTGEIEKADKSAFLEGQMFESIVTGNKELFMSQHPEIISTRGATTGEIKSEFKKVLNAADKFMQQPFLTNIVDSCEKQVILTGEINKVKIKGCLDLFKTSDCSIYDFKCMKDFKEQWIKEEKAYAPWYYVYNYPLQLAVYRELVKQNFGKEPKEIGLIATTKEDIPDIEALSFDYGLLDLELEKFADLVPRFNDIKLGKIEPIACGVCDYCKLKKKIEKFEEIK